MKKFIIIICILFGVNIFSGCQNLYVSLPRDEKFSNNKTVKDKLLGMCQLELSEGCSLELIMYNGEYYQDAELGAFQGENWLGNCKLVIKQNEKIKFEYKLDDDWSEAMRFGSQFVIAPYDYDSDGQLEFLIGQYLSSNINEYKLYRITKQKTIEKVDGGEHINISGKNRYSCTFDIGDNHEVTYEYYDNSTGKIIKRTVRFEGDKVVIE